jgi:dTDP-4-dehydrorhamnose 3,5-epimerase
MPFEFKPLDIPGLVLITSLAFQDERGFFMETYKHSDFARFGIREQFVQDNHSFSKKNVLRGLHFQCSPKAQGKLVQAVAGEIFDVAVDLRTGSRTFGKWVSETLSGENHRMLYIPAGFAHGFYVLSDSAHVTYKVTEEFSHEHDAGVAWNDPDIGISWPMQTPVLSAKDAALPRLRNLERAHDPCSREVET